jgi:hypothetical protein
VPGAQRIVAAHDDAVGGKPLMCPLDRLQCEPDFVQRALGGEGLLHLARSANLRVVGSHTRLTVLISSVPLTDGP